MSGFDPSFMNFIVACKTSTTNQLQHQQISYHTRAAADHLQHCTADGENWISLSLSLSFLLQQNWSRRSRESASVAGVYCGDEEEDPLGRERKRAAWVGNGQVEKGRWRKGEGRGWTVEVRNQWFFKQDFVM
jgi:hypothetical protein